MNAIQDNITKLSILDMSEGLSIAQIDVLINNILSGSGSLISEQLTGTIDGNNTIFTTSNNFVASTTTVYINGLRQRRGVDYTETGLNEITLSQAPLAVSFTDYVEITYTKA